MLELSKMMKTGALLLSALSLWGCTNESDVGSQEKVLRPAKIFEVGQNTQALHRNFPAQVEANADSKLAFRVSGQIIKLPVKTGENVKQGQVLARLDPKDFKLRLDDRQARFGLAKAQFERAKSMLNKKLIAQSQYDEALANLRVSQSALDAARVDLDYTYLRAPFAGSIAQRVAENHENIQAKQTVFTLQTNDRIDISIQVPERLIAHLKPDTSYEPSVSFASYPHKHYLAQVKEWDTVADPITLTYKVVFSMATPSDINILPGMSANLRADLFQITDYPQTRFQLPVESVFTSQGSSSAHPTRYIWKLNPVNKTVSRVEVTVGEIKAGGIEVLSGVAQGDKIISAGVHFLVEGMQVRPWNREEGL